MEDSFDASHVHDVSSLRALIDVSRDLSAATDLDTLIKRIEQAAIRVIQCERVSVFLFDPERDELWSRFATGESEIRFSAHSGIAGDCIQTQNLINVADAYADPRFNKDVDRATGYRTRNILAIPLAGYDGSHVGVVQLLNKTSGSFTGADEDLALVLSSLTGVAVQRQLLLDEFAEKQRMLHDLEIAREIQQSLLPDQDPTVVGFDVAGWNEPADETGGDCFDFVELESGKLAILIADATGHGVGPALMASTCRALIRALASVTEDPGEILFRTNEILRSDLTSGRFLTAFLGILDPGEGTLSYVSAGQAPLLYLGGQGTERVSLEATTVPLGIVPLFEAPPVSHVRLAVGDVFILLSDGFYEWDNATGDQYGVERTFDFFVDRQSLSSAEAIAQLHESVLSFADGIPQSDDLTAVVIRRTD
jgi:phosphoserine phosphatase